MMSKTCFAVAIIACAMVSVNGIFLPLSTLTFGPTTGAVTATAAGAAAGTTVFLTPTGATLIAGAALLKGLAIAGIAAGAASRAKRDVETEDDVAFIAIAQAEPAACYRRLICDLATGQMPKSDNDVIVGLFNKPVSAESPKFDFATAAQVGKNGKNVQLCELRYSCPLSNQEIAKLFN